MDEALQYLYKETDDRVDFLVLWLHGLGADGYDFAPLIDALELPITVGVRYVFPHAPMRSITINGGMQMRAWYDIQDINRLSRVDYDGVNDSCRKLSDLLEIQQKETGVPYERSFIGGFSQGGAISLHMGLRYPMRLAGILSLSSYILSPIDLVSERNDANKQTPVFVAHGHKDEVIDFMYAKKTEETLQKISQPFDFYPHNMEHTVPMETLRAMSDWMTKRIHRLKYGNEDRD